MPAPARHIDDSERRARLARRHAIHPRYRVSSAEAATVAMTVLHATEPSTVYLSVCARTHSASVREIDHALYERRGMVKQLAMRRTLFVFPPDLLPAALGSASARVALAQRARVAKEVTGAGLTQDGNAWLTTAMEAVYDHLGDGIPRSAQQIRTDLPAVAGQIHAAPGTKWGQRVQVTPWVLTQLGLEGRVVRGPNTGHWRTSRPAWTRLADWLGNQPEPTAARDGYAELVRRWLRTFGPGTADDLKWWLGSTKTAVGHALTDVSAVPVSLDGGGTGWVLPEDLDPEPDVEPWAALLPVLDPTTMGWKERDFYLDPAHVRHLFDSNGNGGTTAWWDGRVVGCWVQDSEGAVRVVPRGPIPAKASKALQAEADRLTSWLDGVLIANVYKSALMKGDVR